MNCRGCKLSIELEDSEHWYVGYVGSEGGARSLISSKVEMLKFSRLKNVTDFNTRLQTAKSRAIRSKARMGGTRILLCLHYTLSIHKLVGNRECKKYCRFIKLTRFRRKSEMLSCSIKIHVYPYASSILKRYQANAASQRLKKVPLRHELQGYQR